MIDEFTSISVERRGDYHVVRLPDDGLHESDAFEVTVNELRKVAGDMQQPRVVFDMNGVVLVSSPMLGVFIETHKRCSGDGGSVSLAAVSPELHGVLEVTRLTHLIKVFGSVDEAVGQDDVGEVDAAD